MLGKGKRNRHNLTQSERLKEAGEVVDKAWIRDLLGEFKEDIFSKLEPTVEAVKKNTEVLTKQVAETSNLQSW